MFARIALIVACLNFGSTLCAQEEFPESMVGFLKADHYVSVSFRENHNLSITIYQSKDDWNLLRDSRTMELDALKKKYPVVEQQEAEAIEEAKKRSPKGGLPANYQTMLFRSKSQFGKILNVGKDFVLVEFDSRRTLYALHMIDTVAWSEGKVNLQILGK